MNEERLISIKEAATLSGLSTSTIRRGFKKGFLKGVERAGKFGREYLIYECSLKEWTNGGNGKKVFLTEVNERAEIDEGLSESPRGRGEIIFDIPMEGVLKEVENLPEKGLYENFVTKDLYLKIFSEHQGALVRLGQLENQRLMLTERAESLQKIEEEHRKRLTEIEEEKKKIENELAKEKDEKFKIHKELLIKNAPWWKKAFYSKEKIEAEVNRELGLAQ